MPCHGRDRDVPACELAVERGELAIGEVVPPVAEIVFAALHVAGWRYIRHFLPGELPRLSERLQLRARCVWTFAHQPCESLSQLIVGEAAETAAEDPMLCGEAADRIVAGAFRQFLSERIDQHFSRDVLRDFFDT